MLLKLAIHFSCLVFPCRGESPLQKNAFCDSPCTDAGMFASASAGDSLLQQSRQTRTKDVLLAEPALNHSMSMQGASTAHRLTPEHVAPKVLRSLYDKRTLFYHVHVPRTAGTFVANLLVADICAPESEVIGKEGWNDKCGKTCEMGLSDNMLSCSDNNRPDFEHSIFETNFLRAEKLREDSGAEQVVFVTTLRAGSARLISQWAKEVSMQTFVHPPEVKQPGGELERYSSDSLRSFVNGTNLGPGWIAGGNYLARNNLQVATLASVPLFAVTPVTRDHLEHAKSVLTKGNWIIGFTNCIGKLHEKLMQRASVLHPNVKPKLLPENQASDYQTSVRGLSQDVLKEVEAASALDTELFKWAQETAAADSADDRWAGC
mmetsp:Transcript_45557/g.79217  ORF Transcript_45557/g.79217 Transcript_45557/m.79217 type:complete len:376 (-) Transcript_45557:125-1252(-)